MTRNALIVLASAAVLGCSEHTWPTTPDIDNPRHPITPAIVEFSGTIVVTDGGSVQLQLADGDLILLVGPETARLTSVSGGEVIVAGTVDANPGLVVARFQVLAMNGRPALDGIVVEDVDGIALQLADGSLRYLANCPAALADEVGARVWITGLDEPPVEYGVIDAR